MLFRRKKAEPEPAVSAPAPDAAASAAVAKTQFLTGDGRVDRRTIEVLLAAIARVSQSQDIEHLLPGHEAIPPRRLPCDEPDAVLPCMIRLQPSRKFIDLAHLDTGEFLSIH